MATKMNFGATDDDLSIRREIAQQHDKRRKNDLGTVLQESTRR
jgi:hypothetical protein